MGELARVQSEASEKQRKLSSNVFLQHSCHSVTIMVHFTTTTTTTTNTNNNNLYL